MSKLTRVWHHPDYRPGATDLDALAKDFPLDRIAFDDPEVDEFVEVLGDGVFRLIAGLQETHQNWRNKPRHERQEVYASAGDELVEDFERFDELMRTDLTALEPVSVDFDQIPFGYDRKPNGPYRGKNGALYHVGPRSWLAASGRTQLTVITTETLVSLAVKQALSKQGRRNGEGYRYRPFHLDLTNTPGVYPIKIPTLLDPRARSENHDKSGVSTLARDILETEPNAIVISDGAEGVDGVLSFQAAKGMNGLEERDVRVIVTNLHPEKFAQLNVLGQWIGRPDVIGRHYADQINQAVGRNRGFRDRGDHTSTVVVTSRRLWVNYLNDLQKGGRRTLLYLDPESVGSKPGGGPPP
jgi:hypothetical protein